MNNKAFCFLGLGIAIRMTGILTHPIWADEAWQIEVSQLPFMDMIKMHQLDFNPPLWSIVTWMTTRLFGINEIGIRLPALLLSILSLAIAWLVIEKLVEDEVIRLAAFASVAILPYQIWQAQEGRCYALIQVLYVAGMWFAINRKTALTVSMGALLIWTHSTGVFYAIGLGLILLVINWKSALWMVLAPISFLPWVPAIATTTSQIPHWLWPLSAWELFRSLAITSTGWASQPMAILTWSVVLGLAVFGTIRNARDQKIGLLSIFGLAPLAGMLAFSILIRNVIFYRPAGPLVAAMLPWIIVVIWPKGLKARAIAWYIMIGIMAIGLMTTNGSQKGGSLSEWAGFISHEWQDGDVIYNATWTTFYPMRYYLPDDEYIIENAKGHVFSGEGQPLENIPHKRAWLIWSKDSGLLSQSEWSQLQSYADQGQLIGQINLPQLAPVSFYLIDGGVK
ncbi:MAG TPA: hypothetical protein PKW33_15510 [Anaerolineaceae bacterium]|nr:hypothetical protein [Anaerolineaceae bacterium]HPN53002.1 hypothetical protein [Anaerolineaceae bacterium]